MDQNVGMIDRIVRGLLGLIFVAASLLYIGLTTPVGLLVALIGIVLLITAGTGLCPLYRMIGISTMEKGFAKKK